MHKVFEKFSTCCGMGFLFIRFSDYAFFLFVLAKSFFKINSFAMRVTNLCVLMRFGNSDQIVLISESYYLKFKIRHEYQLIYSRIRYNSIQIYKYSYSSLIKSLTKRKFFCKGKKLFEMFS